MHASFLQTVAAKEEESIEAFLAQLTRRISHFENKFKNIQDFNQDFKQPIAKIASIDVDVKKIHKILHRMAKTREKVRLFLSRIGGLNTKNMNVVLKTHVTMAHWSTTPQSEIHSTFDCLVDKLVILNVTGFLFSRDVAALRVEPASFTSGDPSLRVPNSRNEFVHITVWCAEEVEAAKANCLPGDVEEGLAEEIIVESAHKVEGVFSLWLLE